MYWFALLYRKRHKHIPLPAGSDMVVFADTGRASLKVGVQGSTSPVWETEGKTHVRLHLIYL